MMFATTRLAPLASLLLPLVSATFSFGTFADSNPTNESYALSASWGISGPCTTAYNFEIPCETTLIEGHMEVLATQVREGFCTNQCIDGLRTWRDGVRAKCSADDVKVAIAQLSDINSNGTIASGTGPVGAMLLAVVSDPNLIVVEQLYFQLCMRDLESGDLCPPPEIPGFDSVSSSGSDSDSDSSSEFNATSVCPDTCTTQAYLFANGVSKLFGSEIPAELDIQTLCPDVDFSVFPQTLSQKPVASYSFESSSPTNNTANNGTKDKEDDDKKNAAATLGGSLWRMGSIIAAVGIAVFVF